MCTAISFLCGKHHYFGRNLDLECSFGEKLVITPRKFPLTFRAVPDMEAHYALMGVAHVEAGIPLYYDAVNERGLSMAGLNFPGWAVYHPRREGADHVAPFELIPYILGQCADLAQARELLARVRVWDKPFSPKLPNTPLHWMVSDRTGSLAVESVAEGLRVYENPVGVLTNAPPFAHQLSHLRQFANTEFCSPSGDFISKFGLAPDSRGSGALGLPGDWSSPSRFVRAAFLLSGSRCGAEEWEQVSQCFHILSGVEMVRGSVLLPDGQAELTRYSVCCDTGRLVYHWRTYDGKRTHRADMKGYDLEGTKLTVLPVETDVSEISQVD